MHVPGKWRCPGYLGVFAALRITGRFAYMADNCAVASLLCLVRVRDELIGCSQLSEPRVLSLPQARFLRSSRVPSLSLVGRLSCFLSLFFLVFFFLLFVWWRGDSLIETLSTLLGHCHDLGIQPGVPAAHSLCAKHRRRPAFGQFRSLVFWPRRHLDLYLWNRTHPVKHGTE